MENIQSESELNKLEMLIEEVKLNGNLLLRDFLVMDDVRAQDLILEKELHLMVNIAAPKMDDIELVGEYTKIHKSIWAAIDPLAQWQVQEFKMQHSLNVFLTGKVRYLAQNTFKEKSQDAQ